MWEADQCGHILHIGDDALYLRASKQTDHAVHFDFDHNGVADFFANMTTIDVPMHTGSSRRLHIKLNDVIYSVYDDTIVPNSQE